MQIISLLVLRTLNSKVKEPSLSRFLIRICSLTLLSRGLAQTIQDLISSI